jgi:hypothetical protein
METDPETHEVDAHLLDCEIGNTTLQDYYTERGDPGADISHWWYSVKRRVWSETQARGAGPLFEWIQLPAQRGAVRETSRTHKDREGERGPSDE